MDEIMERTHDPLCPAYDTASFANSKPEYSNAACQCELISKVRAESTNNPENDLGFKAVIAEKICGSEPFMWLMNGANHPKAHLDELKPLYLRYLAEGGGWGKNNQPKKTQTKTKTSAAKETESFNRGVKAMRNVTLKDIADLQTAFKLSSSPDPRILGLLKLLTTAIQEHELTDEL